MPIMGAVRFEELFRRAAELDVDKSDLKRLGDFINQKLYDLFSLIESESPHSLPKPFIHPPLQLIEE